MAQGSFFKEVLPFLSLCVNVGMKPILDMLRARKIFFGRAGILLFLDTPSFVSKKILRPDLGLVLPTVLIAKSI